MNHNCRYYCIGLVVIFAMGASFMKATQHNEILNVLAPYDYHNGPIAHMQPEKMAQQLAQVIVDLRKDPHSQAVFSDTLNIVCSRLVGSQDSASWFRGLQININSAAIIIGITAACYAAWHAIAPLVDHSIRSIRHRLSKEEWYNIFMKAGHSMSNALFLATVACALEGFNQYWVKGQYNQRKNYCDAARMVVDALTHEVTQAPQ